MRLSSQVVDLGWFSFVHNFDQTVPVNQISVMKDHFPLSETNQYNEDKKMRKARPVCGTSGRHTGERSSRC